MSGATNRRRGHSFERDLANWFTGRLGIDVRTGRSVTGGTQQGADLITIDDHGHIHPHVMGWAIEAKDHARAALAGWLKQAADAAQGRPFAVIHKRRQSPVRCSWVYVPAVWAQELFAVGLRAEVRHVTVDLELFTAALRLWEVNG